MGAIITRDSVEMTQFMSAIDSLISRLEEVAEGCKPSLNGESYMTDKELSSRLQVSRRTTQEWRTKGKVDYIQLEGKVLYPESAIQRMLEKHYRKAR